MPIIHYTHPSPLPLLSEAAIAALGLAALYNPSDLTSMYQGRTGGDAAAVNAVVGTILDKSQMGGKTAAQFITDQPELITNGTFDTDTAGWSMGTSSQPGTFTSVGGKGRVSVTGAFAYFAIPFATTIGRTYKFSGSISAPTGGPAYYGIRVNTSDSVLVGSPVDVISVTEGEGSIFYTATTTTTYVVVQVNSVGTSCDFDNISCKAVPGNHAVAPSDASRGILRQNGSLFYIEFDGVDDRYEIADTSDLDFGSSDWLVAAGAEMRGASAYDVVWGKGTGASADHFRCFVLPTDNVGLFHAGDAGGAVSSTQQLTRDVASVLEWGINGPDARLGVDGAVTTAPKLGGIGSNSLSAFIGSDVAGYVSEMHLYAMAISGSYPASNDLANLRAFLAAKSGVTL